MMRREITRGSQWKGESNEAIEIIARASTKLGLPVIVKEEAERIFQEGTVRGLFRGRSLPAGAGAALYAACRRYRLPQTLVEVSEALSIRRWEVGRAFKTLNRGMPKPVPVVGFGAYLQRYAEELALSPAVRSTVEEMLQVASKRPEVSGLSPHGLVAALIYLASEENGERKTRSEIARLGSVTEMTLRTTTKLLDRILKESEPTKH
jgi:transcription initiation factor TFIIB